MKDMITSLQIISLHKLKADAAEYSAIRDRTADPQTRERFGRIADHLYILASELDHAISTQMAENNATPH